MCLILVLLLLEYSKFRGPGDGIDQVLSTRELFVRKKADGCFLKNRL